MRLELSEALKMQLFANRKSQNDRENGRGSETEIVYARLRCPKSGCEFWAVRGHATGEDFELFGHVYDPRRRYPIMNITISASRLASGDWVGGECSAVLSGFMATPFGALKNQIWPPEPRTSAAVRVGA